MTTAAHFAGSACQTNERFGVDGAAFALGDSAAALGAEQWQRLRQLEQSVCRRQRTPGAAAPPAARSERGLKWRAAFDVVIVGGGLATLLAPLLAAAGHRVAVVERARGASAHREWNASASELQVLVDCGLCTQAELAALIVARYRTGSCAWHGHGTTYVQGVLDCAVDAAGLLALARRKSALLGVQWFDETEAGQERATDDQVTLPIRTALGPCALDARLLVDARGVQSPHGRADLLCPTVGGVFADLTVGDAPDCWQPDTGEILATTADVEDGRQYLWEAFPNRPGELTVYLFAYLPAAELTENALSSLYERFWRTLPTFKRGRARLVRPTYGIIPGWSRRRPGAASPHRRIMLVGDAAARHSPLTFCGFGAMLRSLAPARAAAEHVLKERNGRPPAAVDDAALHTVTGALAGMMAAPPAPAGALNALLAASFATLADMGNEAYASLLQDRMRADAISTFLWRTSRRHPLVWRYVRQHLGFSGAASLAARFAGASLARRG